MDIVRRCDHCRNQIPLNVPVITVDVRMKATRLVSLRAREYCSEACTLAAVRSLFREASLPLPGWSDSTMALLNDKV